MFGEYLGYKYFLFWVWGNGKIYFSAGHHKMMIHHIISKVSRVQDAKSDDVVVVKESYSDYAVNIFVKYDVVGKINIDGEITFEKWVPNDVRLNVLNRFAHNINEKDKLDNNKLNNKIRNIRNELR